MQDLRKVLEEMLPPNEGVNQENMKVRGGKKGDLSQESSKICLQSIMKEVSVLNAVN